MDDPRTSPSRSDAPDSRLLAAIAYVPGLCILTLLLDGGEPFARFHARQGLVLLFVELVSAVLVALLASTIGRLPILGPFLVGVIKLALGLAILGLAAIGAARAAIGERWRMPVVAEYAERLSL